MPKKNSQTSWVKQALQKIACGEIAKVRPLGGSMRGRIESGQLVTLQPVTIAEIQVEDAIFVKWKSNYLLHLVKEIQEDKVLIGNNLGKINGWVTADDVLAKVVCVGD